MVLTFQSKCLLRGGFDTTQCPEGYADTFSFEGWVNVLPLQGVCARLLQGCSCDAATVAFAATFYGASSSDINLGKSRLLCCNEQPCDAYDWRLV
jgi:hypothetical protein